MSNLFTELKRRNVFKAVVAYIIATCRRAGIDAKVATPLSQKSRHTDIP